MSDTNASNTAPDPGHFDQRWRIALSGTVLIPGLGISAWSFYSYAREAHTPALLAASASSAIDGIGLFAAYFAARFTNRGQPAMFPRAVTYLMIVASVYVNWNHASAQGWSPGLHVLVSAPAVASAFAFEILMLELRVNERARSEKRRRARASAKISADLWLHHPFTVWSARRWESRDRLAELFPGHRNPTGETATRSATPTASTPGETATPVAPRPAATATRPAATGPISINRAERMKTVAQMIREHNGDLPLKTIADRFGCSIATASRMRAGALTATEVPA